MMYLIVETDNFGRDYPDEKFVNLPPMRQESAIAITNMINEQLCSGSSDRTWMVVPFGYTLQPGFEP